MDVYTQYAELDQRIKHLEKQKKDLEKEIIIKFEEENKGRDEENQIKSYQLGIGKITLCKRPRYQYPDYVVDAVKLLKDQIKVTEQKAKDEAVVVYTESIRFTPKKVSS